MCIQVDQNTTRRSLQALQLSKNKQYILYLVTFYLKKDTFFLISWVQL